MKNSISALIITFFYQLTIPSLVLCDFNVNFRWKLLWKSFKLGWKQAELYLAFSPLHLQYFFHCSSAVPLLYVAPFSGFKLRDISWELLRLIPFYYLPENFFTPSIDMWCQTSMYTCLGARSKPVQKVVMSHCPTEDESSSQHLGLNHPSSRQPLAAGFTDTNIVS